MTIPCSMLPVLALALGCVASAAAAQPASFDARCNREMLPQLEVRALPLDYEIDNSVASRKLFYRSEHVHSGDMMLGSTALRKTSEVSFGGNVLIDAASGRECLAPYVAVTLTFRPVSVFIAREFPPDSCSYNTVLNHELRHVKLYQDEIPRMEVFLRDQLALRYGARPIFAAAGEGIVQLQRDVDDWLRPLIVAELARIDKLQMSVDTFEEKTQMSMACLGQVAENLRLDGSSTWRGW